MLSAPDFIQKQIIIALLSLGDKLSFKNDNIIIKDQDGKIKHQSTCYRLFALFIVGHASITTGLLQRAKKFNFSITLLSYGLIPYGTWLSKTEGNVLLREKQYQYKGNEIAQRLIKNKIAQQLHMLKKIRKKSPDLKQAIKTIKSYHNKLPDKKQDMQSLLGIEGSAARLYFKHLFAQMDWHGRKPRVKHDITNLLLDIGYTQLFHFMDALLNLYGFDNYKGVYHKCFYQRKSLVCDLVEPFRPIVDYQVRKAIKLNQVNVDDFDYIHGQYRIFGKKAHPYIALLLRSLLEHKQEIFLYTQSYYRAFMQDKPIEQYPIFTGEKSC